MKEFERYMVFAFDGYYPSGGMGDYQESFHSLDEATQSADNLSKAYDFCEVLDVVSKKIVYKAD